MPTEAPNTLLSNARVRILDLVSEGTIQGLYPVSGVSGSNPLCSIYLDDTPILNGDGSANVNISGQGFSWGIVTGTTGQDFIDGFAKVEALIPLPLNTRVTNPPPNSGFPKPVVASFNTTMFPDAEAVKVTIRIPALFSYDKDTGNTNPYNIGWQVDAQLNDGAWVNLDVVSITNRKCTSPFYKTSVYTLPKTDPISNFYKWKLRISRTTQFIESSNVANDLFVDSIAVISSNSYTYPMSAMVGLSLSADQFAGIPSRSYDVLGIRVAVPQGYTPTRYGVTVLTRQCDYDGGNKLIGFTSQVASEAAGIYEGAVVSGPDIPLGTKIVEVDRDGPYVMAVDTDPLGGVHTDITLTITGVTPGTIDAAVYPEVWNGTWGEKQWTNNPAWIFYDLCTNKRYGLGNYIRPEWIDKWTLYEIAQYCDEMVDDGDGGTEPRFTCNVAIQTPQDAYSLLNNLISVFRGMLYWASGRIYPVGSETRDPVFNFSNANVIGGAFTYSDTPKNTRSTVCAIKWVDPNNLFRTSVERVEDPDAIAKYGVIEKEITAFATTSRGQAIRAANWMLTVEQQLTETVSFETDQEGLYLRPGDVFNLYDNYRNNQQQGGRIADFSSDRTTISLDKDINLEAGFTYYMTALVPAATFGTGVTGSSQIDGIRNSQIESRRVTTAAANQIDVVTVTPAFSSNLYKGSVWIMNASGSAATVFDQATQYKTLSIAEAQPGIFSIIGVEYNTGVNYLVNNNYSVEVSPPLPGDTIPPLHPTGLIPTRITGLLVDNTFFSYVSLGWTGSVSDNVAYYKLSGQLGAGAPFVLGKTPASQLEFNYTPDAPGNYVFSVGAYNANGYGSVYNRASYTEPATNPLPTAPLSGIYISSNFDPYSVAPAPISRYTGWLNNTPGFTWNISGDPNTDLEEPSAQFISGYRVRLLKLTDNSSLASDIIIEGKDSTTWTAPEGFLQNSTSLRALRAFKFSVESLDDYGNVRTGASLNVYNNPPRPPVSSGFFGLDGGLIYNINPSRAADTSGLYFWTSTSPSFTPNYGNVTYNTTNFAGNAPVPAQNADGSFYTWFSVLDNYGFSGSLAANGDLNAPIYGPISGNSTDILGSIDLSIAGEIDQALASISGAFSLLTGEFTNSLQVISGENQRTLLAVNGLSGQIIGSVPGAANTALTVRVDTAVVSSSGALAQQIDAVSARLQTTGQSLTATVGTVSTALTNSGIALGSQINVVQANVDNVSGALRTSIGATGATLLTAVATADGALAQWITNLGVQTTGASASVRIGAEAFVTGQISPGIGGVAVARWGFELDANGKVASLKATNNSFSTSYPKIEFGNIDAQSSSFTQGSVGWRIRYNGDAEFNNGVFRGDFTGGAASSQIAINNQGFKIGNFSSDRIEMGASTSKGIIYAYNPGGTSVATFGAVNAGGSYPGTLQLSNNAGSLTITAVGDGGSINCDILDVDSTSNFDGTITANASTAINAGTNAISVANGSINRNGSNRFELSAGGSDAIAFETSSSERWFIGGSDGHFKSNGSYRIMKSSSDGWTVPLYDGDNEIAFQWDGSALNVKIDSTEYTITIT